MKYKRKFFFYRFVVFLNCLFICFIVFIILFSLVDIMFELTFCMFKILVICKRNVYKIIR